MYIVFFGDGLLPLRHPPALVSVARPWVAFPFSLPPAGCPPVPALRAPAAHARSLNSAT